MLLVSFAGLTSAQDSGKLLDHPSIKDRPIIFVTRHQYRNEHGAEATMYQTGEVNTNRPR